MLKELFDMSGRVAFITGGSKGIGKAVGRGFAEAGADIAISARTEVELKAAAKEIGEGLKVKVLTFTADMTDRAASDKLAADVQAALGRVDVLFNNAGSNTPEVLLEQNDETWDRLLELNLTSCMRLARAIAPGMIERKWGRIIHTSSVMALASSFGRGCYSATKAALVGMMRAHALELGPHGITVNCLAPGPIATDLPMSLLNDDQKKRFAARTALLRWGETIDMVGPVLMLGSNAGAYITGHILSADGGMLCRTFD